LDKPENMFFSNIKLLSLLSCLTIISIQIPSQYLGLGFISPVFAKSLISQNPDVEKLLKQADSQADQGNPEAALQSYQQALALAKSKGDRLGEGNSIHRIGSLYLYDLKSPEKARPYYQKALEIAQSISNLLLEAKALLNFGNTYKVTGDYNQSIAYHEKSLVIARKAQSCQVEATALEALGYDTFTIDLPKATQFLENARDTLHACKEDSSEATKKNLKQEAGILTSLSRNYALLHTFGAVNPLKGDKQAIEIAQTRSQLNTPVASQSLPVTATTQPQPITTAAIDPPKSAVAPSPPNVYKIAKATTLLIEGQASGSGVIISKVGNTYFVLTAKHVVQSQDEYTVTTPSGKKYPLDYKQIKKLADLDLAVAQFTSNENLSVAQLGNSETVDQGDVIYVSGWPAEDQAITKHSQLASKGEIAGVQPGNADGYELMYGNSTGPGMSGGRIFNSNGQVIGIHGRAAGNEGIGKVGINLGIPVHLFLRQAPQAGLNLNQLGLRAEK
jgi:S1-C subfamily serine protease